MPPVRLISTRLAAALFLVTTLASCDCSGDDASGPLTVWAAASLTDVMPKIAEAWRDDGGGEVTFSFDGSSRLARQIESGAPADLFFSADTRWMGYLEEHGRIADGTRTTVATNRLVVVVPADAGAVPGGPDELDDPRLRHIAVAAEEVPAGRYAEQALTRTGVLEAVRDRLVRGGNVRTALEWVAAGEADAGIVYGTDARAEPRVREAFAFGATTHDAIVYPAAVTHDAPHPDRARALLRYCRGERARRILRDAGFEVP